MEASALPDFSCKGFGASPRILLRSLSAIS